MIGDCFFMVSPLAEGNCPMTAEDRKNCIKDSTMSTLNIEITGPEEMMPHYGSTEAAGADLRACVDESVVIIEPGEQGHD